MDKSGTEKSGDNIKEEPVVVWEDPDDVPDRVMHRIMCGCKHCYEALKK